MTILFEVINKCLLVVTLTLVFNAKTCLCDVIVTSKNYSSTLARFHSASASFGESLPSEGLKGVAIKSVPEDGCHEIEPPPSTPHNMSWIAVIARYGRCKFEDKVRFAMGANFSAVIVYNVESNKVIQMGGDDDSLIPSVFIGHSSAMMLLNHFMYVNHPDFRLILTDDDPFDINTYLLPFAIVVGICFLIMLGIVIFKCFQDHRRRMRHRLPKSALKKLPIHKFKEGDPFETCCICLDDFEEGDKLRILPCDHAYHSKCIDSWLVKHKRICPQCRKRVFDRGTGFNNSSDNDSDTNERAPLLGASAARPGTSGSAGGTFSNQPQAGTSGMSSRTGILDRLQAVQEPNRGGASSNEPSTSNPGTRSADSFLTVNESRRLQGQRRFRRPRRLRRVYEVLTESTSNSDHSDGDEDDQNQESDVENHSGEARQRTSETQAEVQVLNNSHPGQNSNEVAACEVHVQVHSGRRSHLNEPSTEQDYITNDVEADVEDESPPISQRAEENPGNDNVEYLERNREHYIEMVTGDDDNNSEEDSSDDNDDHDHEQVSTSIVTSRSPPDTHPSVENA